MGGRIFFTSDTHFNHENIIRYCNRPWNLGKDDSGNIMTNLGCVNRMNEEMVENWNRVVTNEDIVWHLGDFCLGKDKEHTIPEFTRRLNGRKRIILGNHDRNEPSFYVKSGFEEAVSYGENVIIDGFVILSHEPLGFLNKNCPFFNIFGHVHDSESYQTFTKNSACVCVERHNYTPVSYEYIREQYERIDVK